MVFINEFPGWVLVIMSRICSLTSWAGTPAFGTACVTAE
jgi:hypothetical protein